MYNNKNKWHSTWANVGQWTRYSRQGLAELNQDMHEQWNLVLGYCTTTTYFSLNFLGSNSIILLSSETNFSCWMTSFLLAPRIWIVSSIEKSSIIHIFLFFLAKNPQHFFSCSLNMIYQINWSVFNMVSGWGETR